MRDTDGGPVRAAEKSAKRGKGVAAPGGRSGAAGGRRGGGKPAAGGKRGVGHRAEKSRGRARYKAGAGVKPGPRRRKAGAAAGAKPGPRRRKAGAAAGAAGAAGAKPGPRRRKAGAAAGAAGAAGAKPGPRRRKAGAAAGAAGAKPGPRRRKAGAAAGAAGAKPGPRRRKAGAKPKPRHSTGHGKRAVESLRDEIRQYYDASGFLSWSAAAKRFVILGTNEPKGGLVPCPECGLGKLMVVRSKATRKRFVGCSNYYSGCDASSPLLQKARLRALKQPCPACSWPMVIFRYSRNQKWTRQCSNMRCPTRATPAQS